MKHEIRRQEVQNALSTLKSEVLNILFTVYPQRLQPSHIAKALGLKPERSKAFGTGGYELIRGILHYLYMDKDVNHVKGEGWCITDSGKREVK